MPVRTACQDSLGTRVFPAFRLVPEATLAVIIFLSVRVLPGGMLTRHMLAHIAVMNIAAPLLAWSLVRRLKLARNDAPYVSLGTATGVQLVVFFFWHSPLGMELMDCEAIRILAMGSLFAAAVWFWLSILFSIRRGRIVAVAPLLLTGKLVCLIAAILVFAPRLLYTEMPSVAAAMADQQLAGLIMLTACPLTYVGASIAIMARWYNALSGQAEAA